MSYLRPCEASDDAFLHDVFCTTWERAVAALPNPDLARHVLRIQHIAQERRFAGRYPGHQRFVVTRDGEDAGRLYVLEDVARTHLVDLTLLPRFRSQGVGTLVMRDLMHTAERTGRPIRLRVGRRNRHPADLCSAIGFDLVAADDLFYSFEWTPAPVHHVSSHSVP